MIPKRTFWVTVGYSFGIASSVYVRRRVRRTIGPGPIDAASRARTAMYNAKSAVIEGRATMRETERQLRAEYEPIHRRGTQRVQ